MSQIPISNKPVLYNLDFNSRTSKYNCVTLNVSQDSSNTNRSTNNAKRVFPSESPSFVSASPSPTAQLSPTYSSNPELTLSNVVLGLHSLQDQGMISSKRLSKVLHLLSPTSIFPEDPETAPNPYQHQHIYPDKSSNPSIQLLRTRNKHNTNHKPHENPLSIPPYFQPQSQLKYLPLLTTKSSPPLQTPPLSTNNFSFSDPALYNTSKPRSEHLEPICNSHRDHDHHNYRNAPEPTQPTYPPNSALINSLTDSNPAFSNVKRFARNISHSPELEGSIFDKFNEQHAYNIENHATHTDSFYTSQPVIQDDISIWNNSKEMLAKPKMLQNSAFDLSHDDFDIGSDNNVYYYFNDSEDISGFSKTPNKMLVDSSNYSDVTLNTRSSDSSNCLQFSLNIQQPISSKFNNSKQLETTSLSTLYDDNRLFTNNSKSSASRDFLSSQNFDTQIPRGYSSERPVSCNCKNCNSLWIDKPLEHQNHTPCINSGINKPKTRQNEPQFENSSNYSINSSYTRTYNKPLPKRPTISNIEHPQFSLAKPKVSSGERIIKDLNHEAGLNHKKFPFYAEILVDCYEQPENTILFRKGDTVFVTDQVDKGWYIGTLMDATTQKPIYTNSGVFHEQYILPNEHG